ncbi:MAG: hypothetical protein ACE147_08600 [Candidatus Methylomirabilales bacterium]
MTAPPAAALERFYCPRCGYTRPLRPGQDGLRIYRAHEARCRPAPGAQLWLAFVTEDDVEERDA